MFYKVKEVESMLDYTLLVDFVNGERKKYNIKPLFEKWIDFQSLKDIKGLYEQIHVDKGGYGISWNNHIDLSCNELYFNGDSSL